MHEILKLHLNCHGCFMWFCGFNVRDDGKHLREGRGDAQQRASGRDSKLEHLLLFYTVDHTMETNYKRRCMFLVTEDFLHFVH